MLLSFNGDLLHFSSQFLESSEDVNQLFPGYDQQLALSLSYGSAVSGISIVRHEYLRVTEVRTLHIQIERHIYDVAVLALVNIIVHLHSPFEDEKYFLRIITLVVQDILAINFHRFQNGKDREQEVRILVVEELDVLDDLSMSVTHNFSS